MKPVYINGAACISAQKSLEPDFLESLEINLSENIIYAQQPNYKDFIPPAQIRRMSKVVKMGIVSAEKAMDAAGISMPDAIITGTGMGCTEDSEKFLRNVIQNNEDHLTPTNFIQSTHNTVAGQIALGIGCHAYNFTYVSSGSSLEFSLLDAKLQIENGEARQVLVGACDETANRTAELYQLAKIIKKQDEFPIDLLNSETEGVFWGEGAAFFVLTDEKLENSSSEVKAVEISNVLELEETESFAENFLQKNGLKSADIDLVLLGFSGDKSADEFHKKMRDFFKKSQLGFWKHLSGEFNTSSGFAVFLANEILGKQRIPEIIKINSAERKQIRTVLIYNNFLGKEHSFTLLTKA